MDKQAREIIDLLKHHDITYCLDNGTLLGLMREGRLLEDDGDIDISIWSFEEPKIRKLIPLLRKAGYTAYSAAYKGEVFKHNFIPRDNKSRKTVDINIFKEYGKYAWCPMYYFKVNPSKAKPAGIKHSILGSVRGILRICWKQTIARRPFKIHIDALPWRPFLNIGTWWIPSHYLKNTIYHEEFQATIPKDWERYLKFRYGNWQEKASDWVFYRDDGGIKDIKPCTISQADNIKIKS